MSDLTSVSVVFAMPPERDDKVFAFYTDRYTPQETVNYVNVSSVPTEFPQGDVLLSTVNSLPAAPTQLDITYRLLPPLRTSNTGHIVLPTDPSIMAWTLPTDISQMVSTAVEENTTGAYIQIANVVVADTDRRAPVDPVHGAYRFRVDFVGNNSVRNPSFRITGSGNIEVVADDEVNSLAALGYPIIRNTLLFTRETLSEEENTTYYPSHTSAARYSKITTLLSRVVVHVENEPFLPEIINYSPSTTDGIRYSKVTTLLSHSTVG
jgi:hypothetical protein